jgi:superfamily II DNA helicase RecQ
MELKFKCNHCKTPLEYGEIHVLHGMDIANDASFGLPYSTGKKLCQECFDILTTVEKNEEQNNEEVEITPEDIAKEKEEFEKREKENIEFFNKLKIWRYGVSRNLYVPAYCVLSDKTLNLIAKERPKNLTGLINIDGMGSTKIHQYGKDIISIMNP